MFPKTGSGRIIGGVTDLSNSSVLFYLAIFCLSFIRWQLTYATSLLWLSSTDYRAIGDTLPSALVLVPGRVQPGSLGAEPLYRIKGGIRNQKVEELDLKEMVQLQT